MKEETNQIILPTSHPLLTVLRDISRNHPDSMDGMRRVAEAQARVLREALLGPTRHFPEYISKMFPSIRVEHVTDLPAAGIAYWAEHRWHIHIRTTDSPEERTFTVLHQLKSIIDHPLRLQTAKFTAANWDSLANHFAQQVLAPRGKPISV